ncbi:MAG: VOC family protein [Ilumatobacteraceae bacterium]
MVAKSSYQPGTPSWVDLGTPDPAASATFYGDLFGWDVVEGPPEAGGYRMALLRGSAVAGISPQFASGSAGWTTYVSVADADATAALAVEHGGVAVMVPFDVLSVGRMAVFRDPVGATFALWQPREHPGAAFVNEPGALCWNELITDDVDAAMAFYGPVFGWVRSPMPMGDAEYDVLMLGDRAIGGLVPAEGPSWWQVSFAVADCDATVAEAVLLGGSIDEQAEDLPDVGRFAVLADPHGARFGVLASEWAG